MSQFPPWKYLLLILVLLFGALYSAPNLFGVDPAVQVSSIRGFELDSNMEARVETALETAGITFRDIEYTRERLLVSMNSAADQELASTALGDALGDEYVVAPSSVPATPQWLQTLGAEPMVLGLDLQGGIHFLLQVDMDQARTAQLDRYVASIRNLLRDEEIRYRSVSRDRNEVVVELRTVDHRDSAFTLIGSEFENLVPVASTGSETIEVRATVDEQTLIELQQTVLTQNISTLRNRVNELGVSEPIVQQQGADRIVVQLPGLQDPTRAKIVIGSTATVEYRGVDEQNDPFEAQRTGRIPPQSLLYFERNGAPILLSRDVIATGDNLINAQAGFDQQSGQPNVVVSLDPDGARSMLQHTTQNVGNRMAVVFIEFRPDVRIDEDGNEVPTTRRVEEVISAAVTREPFGGRFQTTGLGSAQEAGQLSMLLRAGALAAPMQIIEERTVGPSLGQDNIDQGFNSVMIGFALVLVLMAIYYKLFGLVANVALTVNLVLVVALLSLLGATLTLPGIAGIVLTVGMAVDANVLIYERIREELNNGNTPQAAIRSGYEKAFSTIADANVTTLIAAVVLFLFGTGPIKGFAVTLSLGIVTSMFTAIVGTRGIVHLIYGRKKRVDSLAI
ncbi:MAG: protein translocase subunit SecD [Pseudomonadota bacterium]